MTQENDLRPIAQVTQLIAAELQRQIDTLADLEHSVANLIATQDKALPPATLGNLQDFDLLDQSLRALCVFLKDLSATIDPEHCVDTRQAVQSMPLRSMADRLNGTEAVADTRGMHVELFQ